jgi:hypothetical protein
MSVKTIEGWLFAGAGRPYCVTGFKFDGRNVRVTLRSVRRDLVDTECLLVATFPNAVIRRIDESEAIRDEWPLDLVAFSCEPKSRRWEFVLNCETVGWIWESDLPTVVRRTDVGIESEESEAELFRLSSRHSSGDR